MPDPRHSPQAFVRDRSTWLAYSLLGYYSYLMNGLGPVAPFLRAELRLNYTVASLHFSAFAVGMLLAGLTTDRLVARFGRGRVAWGGAGGMAVATGLLLLGRHPAFTIASALLMGALGSAILVIVPAALADHFGPSRAAALAEANALASICAALAPFCLGFLARTALGWRSALLLPIVFLAAIAVAFRRQPLAEAHLAGARPAPGQHASAGSSPGRLPGLYWAYWALVFLVVSVEFGVVFWSAEFLRQARAMALADAALGTSVFLTGMVLGRFAGSRLMRRSAGTALLLGALALAGCGFLLNWLAAPVPASLAGLLLCGLGVANLYPLSLALAVGSAPTQTDLASARASLASGFAVLVLPLLLGRLADLIGLVHAYACVLAGIGAALALVLALSRRGTAGGISQEAREVPGEAGSR